MKLLLIGHGYLSQAITREFRENGWKVATVTLSGGDGSIACDIGNAGGQINSTCAARFLKCKSRQKRGIR
jgi:hypothetical protein